MFGILIYISFMLAICPLQHPGGMDVLMEHGGTDATVAFDDKGHSNDAKELLARYLIGELVQVCMRSG